MKHLWTSLVNIGITDKTTTREAKHISFLNTVVLLVLFLIIQNLALAAFYYPSTFFLSLIFISHFVSIALTLVFNRGRHYLLGRVWFGLSAALFLTLYTISMGVESHWDLFLGVCVFVSFYIFPESQRRWMVFVILVCSLGFLGVNFGLLAHGLLPDLPLAFVRAETFFNLAGFLFCAISMGAVGYVVINRAEGNLVREHERSELLLHNILPIPIAQRLKKNPGTIADGFEEATILFADIVGFTSYTENVAPDKLVDLLNTIFSEFDNLTDKYGVEKIKTIGDAYVVAAGVPALCANHAEVMADMALEMQGVISNFNARTGQSLKIRIGIHSGSVIAGVIGKKKFAYDLWGDSVNTAARMESHGVPGEIQVTETTYQLLQPKYRLEEREVIDVKGKGPMCTYLLKGRL